MLNELKPIPRYRTREFRDNIELRQSMIDAGVLVPRALGPSSEVTPFRPSGGPVLRLDDKAKSKRIIFNGELPDGATLESDKRRTMRRS